MGVAEWVAVALAVRIVFAIAWVRYGRIV